MNQSKKMFLAAAVIFYGSLCPVYSENSSGLQSRLQVLATTDVNDVIEWVEVNLETAGSLGVEVLYKVDNLSDVKNLKVSGPLNNTDWTTIKNMSQIVNLDLSNASSVNIPEQTFYKRSTLESISFPIGLKTIGESAFNRSGLKTVTLPESLTSIGAYCFAYCQSLIKAEVDGVKTIPGNCFLECAALTEVILHEGLQAIEANCFKYDRNLESINLPSTLKTIGNSTFYECNKLTGIIFPESLTSIGSYAFYKTNLVNVILPKRVVVSNNAFEMCSNLEEVVLPATMFTLDYYIFRDCSKLTKVTCCTPVPPAIHKDSYGNLVDPFYGVPKANVVLTVPSFAVVNYKLDSYWIKFGTIQGGYVSDYWAINGDLSLTNNRCMDGTPTIDIREYGRLTIGGSAPMTLNELYFTQDIQGASHTYAQLINNSPAMTANKIRISSYCDCNRWYYFSMPCDIKMSEISHSVGSDFVFRYYDGEARALNGKGGSWKNVPADGTLEAGKGYIYQSYKEGRIDFYVDKDAVIALLAAGDRITAVSAWEAENASNSGWNLIGNPYMSYYDLSATTLSCPVTIWNQSNKNYDAFSLIDDHVVLEPMQAFFIQQSDVDGEITFGAEGRAFTTVGMAKTSAKSVQATTGSRCLFDIVIKSVGNDFSDRTRVVINPDASLA